MTSVLQALWAKRVPHVVAVYLGGAWGVLEFLGWLEEQGTVSNLWADAVLLLFAVLLPSLLVVAWARGADPSQPVTRLEWAVVPANLVLALVLVWTIASGSDVVSSRPERTEAETGRLTFLETSAVVSISFSPDGSEIAYLTEDSLGSTLIKVPVRQERPPDTLIRLPLVLHGSLRWTRPGGLRFWARVDSLGGWGHFGFGDAGAPLARVCSGTACTFSPDGSTVAECFGGDSWGDRFRLTRVGPEGPDSLLRDVTLSTRARYTVDLDWSPRGNWVAVLRGGWQPGVGQEPMRLEVVNTETGEEWEVATARNLRIAGWREDGASVDYMEGVRWLRRQVNQETGEPVGEPQELHRFSSVPSNLAFSPEGEFYANSGTVEYWAGVGRIDLSSGVPGDIEYGSSLGFVNKIALSISPDGSTFAFWDYGNRGALTLWRPASEEVQLLALPEVGSGVPNRTAWSPEGSALLATIPGGQPYSLVLMDPSGKREPEVIADDAGPRVTWCTGDILFSQGPGNRDLVAMDLSTGESHGLLGDRSRGWLFRPACSQSGDRIAVAYNHTTEGQGLWVMDADGEGEKKLVPDTLGTGGMTPLQWSQDGGWLYYDQPGSWPRWIWRVSTDGGEPEPVARIPAGASDVVMSRSGNAIGFVERRTKSDIWYQRRADPSPPDSASGM